jgi:hypothetical protein
MELNEYIVDGKPSNDMFGIALIVCHSNGTYSNDDVSSEINMELLNDIPNKSAIIDLYIKNYDETTINIKPSKVIFDEFIPFKPRHIENNIYYDVFHSDPWFNPYTILIIVFKKLGG